MDIVKTNRIGLINQAYVRQQTFSTSRADTNSMTKTIWSADPIIVL